MYPVVLIFRRGLPLCLSRFDAQIIRGGSLWGKIWRRRDWPMWDKF